MQINLWGFFLIENHSMELLVTYRFVKRELVKLPHCKVE